MVKRGLTVGTIFLVVALHLPAVLSDSYFFFWWYDVMMHTLGGIAMGFLGTVVWEWLRSGREIKSKKELVLQLGFVLGCVALVGIGWEWTEALVDAVLLPRLGFADAQLGLIDTMLDLYFDIFGGFCAWLLLRAYDERHKK
jgi:hypothetical protein